MCLGLQVEATCSTSLIYLILPAALGPGFTQPPTEMSTTDRNKCVSEEQSAAGA
jgi:hypothetical protein